MPVFAPGLSFSPELVEAIESMKAADSHWVAYTYTISRQVRLAFGGWGVGRGVAVERRRVCQQH